MSEESPKQSKPGYKTTEFWITIGIGIIGAILIASGKETLGTALLGSAGVSYSGARGMAKLK
jgi:hypothetical protein